MQETEDTKIMIESEADQLFMRYGFRSVTMDDIAKRTGVSKKTIYRYFKDKAQLVSTVTSKRLCQEEEIMKTTLEGSENAIDEMMKVSMHIRKMVKSLHASLLMELRKYYPTAWKAYVCYKDTFVFDMISDNIKRGIDEGLYRSNLNPKIMAVARMETVQMGFNTDIFPPDEFKLEDIQIQLLDHFISGLLTAEGHQVRELYLSGDEQNENS